ncbi:hypothetical protein [Aneurinibacillus sp. UBA3580]|jgi:hypothetical protein|uniref:hypothetical protein n=1 Tax=Aneurinibacillus sp. UBA3580 TaxID=1946041 RepID=UPI002580BAE0|nr:hypothetical protein [Aneurinibacillus sp. UBA3580]
MTDERLNEGMEKALSTIIDCSAKLSVSVLDPTDMLALMEAKTFAKEMRKAAISNRDKIVAKKIIDIATAFESVIKRPTTRNTRKQALRVVDGLETLETLLELGCENK